MEQPPHDPAQAEQYWLDVLERESAKVSPSLTALVPVDRQAAVAQLQRAVDYTHNVETWYLSIVPTAKTLAGSGFGRLLSRLNELLAQIRLSRSLCETMLLKRVAAQQAAFDSQPPPPPPPDPAAAQRAALEKQQAEWEEKRKAQQAQFDAWQEAHRKQQEIYDAQNKAWSDQFNKR